MSLDATLGLAAKHGIPLVELRALNGTVNLPATFAAQFGSPTVLAAHVQDSPVRIAALDASLHLVGPTLEERTQLIALAPWADAAGARWLRVFDGGAGANASDFAAAAATLAWWRGVRAENRWQVDLMVETHDSLLTGDAIARFAAALPGTAILWDAHHTWRKGAEDPLVTWQAIRSWVTHVHVKDSIAVASARHPFTYVLPGDGGFPIAPLLGRLHDDGFEGPVSLEWEKMWHAYLPSLDEALTVAQARGWW